MTTSVKAVKNGLFHKIAPSQGIGPFSGRGVAVLAALSYLLAEPVQLSADVVSAALAFGLLALISATAVVLIAHGRLLRRALTLEVHPPEGQAVTGEPVRIVLSLSPVRVLPGCHLDLTLEFEHPELPTPTVRLSGFTASSQPVYADVTFPHRGVWLIKRVRCELVDALGLMRVLWFQSSPVAVTVAPPLCNESRLPILSSTQRAGDAVIDSNNRHGDPYDIKPYHPSDGVKKIVWKAFAKRGELLSRHPEASMTPEGHVVIVVAAETLDDEACSQALSYIRHLEELSLEIVVGCLGRGMRNLAFDAETTEGLLIQSAWDAQLLSPSALQEEITQLLDECAALNRGMTVSKLLLFCEGRHAVAVNGNAPLYQVGTWLQTLGVEPIFCLTQPRQLDTSTTTPTIGSFVRSIVLRPDTTRIPAVSASAHQAFLSECLRKQWEVYL